MDCIYYSQNTVWFFSSCLQDYKERIKCFLPYPPRNLESHLSMRRREFYCVVFNVGKYPFPLPITCVINCGGGCLFLDPLCRLPDKNFVFPPTPPSPVSLKDVLSVCNYCSIIVLVWKHLVSQQSSTPPPLHSHYFF